MVGRLVEQEERRTAQQQFRQLDAHAPAAAEFACRTCEITAFETQPKQRLLDFGFAVQAAENLEAVVAVVEPVQQCLVLLALVVGTYGNLLGQVGDLLFEVDHLAESRFGFGVQRGRVGHFHLLGQVTDRAVTVTRDASRRGRLFAGEHLEHRRFARAVFADQADTVFRIDQERYVFEQIPAAEADGEVVY